jgi:hypothetical protein
VATAYGAVRRMIYPVPGIMTPGWEQAARIAREWCACGITHEPVRSDIWRTSRRPVKLPDESAIVRAKTTRGPVQAKVVSEPCPCNPRAGSAAALARSGQIG